MVQRTVTTRFEALTTDARRDVDTYARSVRGLGTDVEQVNRTVGAASGRISANMDRVGASMGRVGSTMSLTVTPALLLLGRTAVNAASDLQESMAATEVVFGSAARAMESWADTAAESFGQSKRQALEAAAGFGNFFDALGLADGASADMSQTLVELASDMASFSNQDPADMLERLRSGLAGEVEPLRRFGVDLSAAAVNAEAMRLGLENANGEVDQAGLVQARFSLLLAQTANQQGDFARTSDGLANSQRTAKAAFEDASAALGERLLPAMASLTQFATDVLEAFQELPGPAQTAILAFGGLTAAAGPLLIVGSKLVTSWATLSTSVGGLSRVLSSPTVWGGAAAIAGLVLLQDELTATFEAADNFAAAFTAGLTTDDPAMQIAALEEEVAALLDTAERGGSVDFGLFRFFTDSNAQQAYNNARALEEQIDALRATLGLSAEDYGHATGELGNMSQALGAVFPKAEEVAAAVTDTAEAAGVLNTAAAEAESAIYGLNEAFSAFIGVNLTAEQAAQGWVEALQQVRDEVDANGTSLDIMSEAGRTNRDAVAEATQAAYDHVVSLAEQGATMSELRGVFEQHRTDLLVTGQQAGFTRDEIERLITQYGFTPDTVSTLVQAIGVDATIGDAQRVRDAFGQIGDSIRRVTTTFGVHVSGGTTGGSGTITEFAAGGIRDEDHSAQIARGAMRVWAEPETGGEAYIPLAPSKRGRSMEILGKVAEIFGVGIESYADGAITMRPYVHGRIEEMPPVPDLRPGIGWQAMMAALRVQFPGLALISGFRPGAITATGNPSYHGFGRAVDIPPRTDVNHWIYQNYKPITKELIASWPGARQIHNGHDHVYSGITRANHWDHNHWAMANGGIVNGPTRALIGERGPEAVIPLDRPLPVTIVGSSGLGSVGISGHGGFSPLAGAFGGQGTRPGPLPTLSNLGSIADAIEAAAAALEHAAAAADDADDAFDDALADLRKMLEEERRIRKQMADLTRRHNEAVLALERQHTERVHDELDRRAADISDFASVSERFVAGWGNTAGALTDNIIEQAETINRWAAAMDELRARGLDEGLITALGLDDPANIAQAQQLLHATSGELDALNAAWAQRQSAISGRVADEQENLVGGLGDTLVALQSEFTEALTTLNADFVADMADLNAELMAIGQENGLTFAEAIAAGIASGIPGIQAQVSEVLSLLAVAQAAARAVAAAAAGGRGGAFVPRPGIPGGHGGQTPGGFDPAAVAAAWGGVTRPNTNVRMNAPNTGTQRMELVLDDGTRFGAYVRTQADAAHTWRSRMTTAQAVR
jgi:uncharacterized protein YoxC